MSDPPLTRATLLLRLRDQKDNVAWGEMLGIYGPMIYRFVRGRGLQDADAADLVQEVFRSVGAAIGQLEYQPEKGGFRAWLFTITRNKLLNFYGQQKRRGPTGLDADQIQILNQLTDGRNEIEGGWELEYQRQLAVRAMETVKPTFEASTWSAFEMTAIGEQPAADVGKILGISKGAVYIARSRVTAKLRLEIERLLAAEEEWELQ